MAADHSALKPSRQTRAAAPACVGDSFIDGVAESIADMYRDFGLNEAMRAIYNSIKNVLPVFSLSCTAKPYLALWAIKLVEYRENVQVSPEIYSLDYFMTSQDVREQLNFHQNEPILFGREHNELFFEVLAPEAGSAITMPIAHGDNNDIYINLAAHEGQSFQPEHVRFFSRLTRLFVEELRRHFIYLASFEPNTGAGLPENSATNMVRLCPCLKDIDKQLQQVAATDMLALITGETGAGKDVVAKAIHENSARNARRFVKVNCGAIPDSLLDSELFGYEKGAFTGAANAKAGYFEQADGGTIFLDEIGELSLAAQVRLLHVLENGRIQRVGATADSRVDIRIIAATHKNLWEEVRQGRFREDLCYRLFVCHVEVPPLRERKADLPLLIWYFLNKKSQLLHLPSKLRISRDEIQKLHRYPWPGNVRELEHTIERSLLYSQESTQLDIIRYTYNQENHAARPAFTGAAEEREHTEEADKHWPSLEDHTADYIRKALMHTKGKIKGKDGAAALLRINSSTLRYKIKKYGLSYLMHPGCGT